MMFASSRATDGFSATDNTFISNSKERLSTAVSVLISLLRAYPGFEELMR
jgi:hypothetical protein